MQMIDIHRSYYVMVYITIWYKQNYACSTNENRPYYKNDSLPFALKILSLIGLK